jgi:hypothetical protein
MVLEKILARGIVKPSTGWWVEVASAVISRARFEVKRGVPIGEILIDRLEAF